MESFRPARARWAAIGAAMWCAVFAAAHLFWAFGGSIGLASSAGTDLAARRPLAFVVFGLYGVALTLIFGIALIGIASQTASRKRQRIAATLIGVTGVLLLGRGVLVEVALATNLGGVRTAVGPSETHWSQLLWNPWFAIGGGLFIAAALQLRRRVFTAPA